MYKGRRKRTLEYVAIKCLEKRHKERLAEEVCAVRLIGGACQHIISYSPSQHLSGCARLQVKTLYSLCHPSVLRFHTWYETKRSVWLILEYCVGGDLGSLIRAEGRLPQRVLLPLLRNLAAGLLHIHSRGWLHCNLQPASVLLDADGRPRLAGLGLAREMEGSGEEQGRGRGAMPYLAPELLLSPAGPHSTASDLWSLGVLLYECASGKMPFDGGKVTGQQQQETTARAILRDQPAPLQGMHRTDLGGSPTALEGGFGGGALLPHVCSVIGNTNALTTTHADVTPEFAHVVGRLLEKDPARRIAWAELCTHPVLTLSGGEAMRPLPLPAEPRLLHYLGKQGRGLEQALPMQPFSSGGDSIAEDAYCDRTPKHPGRHQPHPLYATMSASPASTCLQTGTCPLLI